VKLQLKKGTRIPVLTALGALAGHAGVAVAQSTATDGIDEVLVFGTQSAADTTTGSRLDLSVLETPATVDIIDGDAVRARIDTNLLDAVTRSAGFTNESNPGNGNSSISARGFNGQGSVTKLYDGTNYFTAAGTITFPFDTWSIERIEVLKGPSSVLYGEGGIGGAINVVPRRPERERSGAVRVIAGQDDTAFLGFDYTGPIGDKLAYRLDYSKSESDNWVRDGKSDAEMLSLALQWDLSDDLTVSARYDAGEQNPMRYFGIPVVDGTFVEAFRESNFNVADSELRYEDDSLRIKADWQASDVVNVQAELYRLATDRFWKNSEYYSYDTGTQQLFRSDPLVLGHDMEQTGLRTNVVFAPGTLIRASVGIEANDINFKRPSNFGPGNPDPIDFDTDGDVVDPFNFVPGTLSDLTDALFLPDSESDVIQHAVFGEIQIKPTEQFSIVAALRYDDYDSRFQRIGRATFDQQVDATTGRIGLVYEVVDNTALYAQYGTGITHPSDSVVTGALINSQADMIESEQTEIGLKHQVGGTGLQLNVALFNIVKNNLVEDDPTSGDPDDVIFIPEQTSHGIEVGLTYAITPSLQIYGNAAVLDAETDTGETPSFVPEQTMNAGFAWSISDAFQVLLDGRYVGERYDASIPLPSYFVVDASARWNATDKLALTLKADNLRDEAYATANYYSDTWILGKPRTVSVALDYRF
jgi:iron complex outermembrane receptor protein